MGFIDHLIDHLAQMTTFEYRRPFGVVIVQKTMKRLPFADGNPTIAVFA